MAKRKVFVHTANKKIRGLLIKENERGYLARGYKVSDDGKKVPTIEFCDKRKSILIAHGKDIDDLIIDDRIDRSDMSPFILKDMYQLVEYYNKLKKLLPCEVYVIPDDEHTFYSDYNTGSVKGIRGIGVSDPKFYPIVVASDLPGFLPLPGRPRTLKVNWSLQMAEDVGAYYCPYIPLSFADK